MIDFLAIGHITHDRVPGGFRLGGTVSFAAVTARRLGRQPGILTRGTPEGLRNGTSPAGAILAPAPPGSSLEGIPVCLLPSTVSTSFVNIYRDGQRIQVVESVADPVGPEALPAAWTQVPVVLLGPVAREVPDTWLAQFPRALVGVTPQGWMRRWDADGHVRSARWENARAFLARADAVIFSREDVGGDENTIAKLAQEARLLVVTDGWRGATVYSGGVARAVPPRATVEVDPTGAGDVFAAAFLVRLAETGDPLSSARFANVVASMSVEAPGVAGIPCRDAVEHWLSRHP